ncbi:MAG TPA: SCO family protein [Solirubrobacteraceae bacterium]|nr:SCO family protein [Solirubrobacteraceae bacterium]
MEAGAGIRSDVSRERPRPAHIAAVLAVAVLLGVAAAAAAHFIFAKTAPAPATVSSRFGLDGQATWAAGARPAPPIAGLHDQTGQVFSLASLRGRTIAMTFFDSHCTQECPLEGRALAAAERALPAAERPVLVAVSVNLADTPASDAAAARAWGLSEAAGWHWLMGTPAALRRVWNEYHIYVGKPVGGDIPHTEALYLVDARGDERSGYLYPFAGRFVTHDLRALAPTRKD